MQGIMALVFIKIKFKKNHSRWSKIHEYSYHDSLQPCLIDENGRYLDQGSCSDKIAIKI